MIRPGQRKLPRPLVRDVEASWHARVQFALALPVIIAAGIGLAIADTQAHYFLWRGGITNYDHPPVRIASIIHACLVAGFCMSYRLDPQRFLSRALALGCVSAAILFLSTRSYANFVTPDRLSDIDRMRIQLGIALDDGEGGWLDWSLRPWSRLFMAVFAACTAVVWIWLRSMRRAAERQQPVQQVSPSRRQLMP